MIPLKSSKTFEGRKMAGARALWKAVGKDERFDGKPVIAVVNSFTQFVPGHVHLHEVGQMVKGEIERLGCFAAEFDTIAIDDGIAMGHEGMLYSLPSREIIADSVEYMCRAHCVDAMICISNCDKITPGMLMAAMRLNIPVVFVSGGPMEAGRIGGRDRDLIDIMVQGADPSVSDDAIKELENGACPTCGCCSGMFTANSMNCLTEAIGLAPAGNGTVLATHGARLDLFRKGAALIVELAHRYYEEGDSSVLPRSIATKDAFENAMSLDIAMGGSTNTVLHLLAVAYEGGVDFKMQDIDRLSRKVPVLCKVAPNCGYHVQDVNRAGGVMGIMEELSKGGFVHTDALRVDAPSLAASIRENSIFTGTPSATAKYLAAPSLSLETPASPYPVPNASPQNSPEADTTVPTVSPVLRRNIVLGGFDGRYASFDYNRAEGCIRDLAHAYSADGGIAVLYGNIAQNGSIVKTAGVAAELLCFRGPATVFESQEEAVDGILGGKVRKGDVVVIRYEGPKGGPGMQEMLYPTSFLKSMKLGKECALITDGRFSGGTSGLSVGHISPEAAGKGDIAIVRNGDIVSINIPERTINVELAEEEILRRRVELERPDGAGYRPTHRVRNVSRSLMAYAALASSADMGGVRNLNQSKEDAR